MSRQPSPLVARRHDGRLRRRRALNAEPPFRGDRRIWASLHVVERRPVNRKRVLRWMREHHLLVPPDLRRKATRTPVGRKPQPTEPNEWWGSEMTTVLVQGCGWVDIVVVLEW